MHSESGTDIVIEIEQTMQNKQDGIDDSLFIGTSILWC